MENYNDTLDKSIVEEMGDVDTFDYLTQKYGLEFALKAMGLIKETND